MVNDGDDDLPDGSHGLDAEEQGRGEVVDPSDALGGKKAGCDKRKGKLVTFEASKMSAGSSFPVLLGQPLQVVLDT